MANAPENETSSKDSSLAYWLRSIFPIFQWLPSYKKDWLRHDLLAGLTHAAYSVPEALVNASLAGVAPQHGLYSFLTGGLVYSVFTTSRHAAVAATSTLSIMVGYSLGAMGMDDPARYEQMAAGIAVLVGAMSLLAWLLRLSDIVNFISDTILSGFRVGAALVIASSQLPKFMGIPSEGAQFL